jgi:hypothetical protein
MNSFYYEISSENIGVHYFSQGNIYYYSLTPDL